MRLLWTLLGVALLAGSADAQTNPPTKQFDAEEIAKVNAWTVGLAAGNAKARRLICHRHLARRRRRR